MKTSLFIFIALAVWLDGCSQNVPHTKDLKNEKQQTMSEQNNNTTKTERTEQEWKTLLNPEQYYVLRQKGTEAPFTGKYYLNKDKGIYVCAACGNELFTSDMKFDSHCGWPSFDREIAGGKIKTQLDTSHGMIRTEIMCAKCGSHLGHIFDDGPTQTGMRYCVNSISLDFKKEK
jgi:methionine-R-sulfoxide reductase